MSEDTLGPCLPWRESTAGQPSKPLPQPLSPSEYKAFQSQLWSADRTPVPPPTPDWAGLSSPSFLCVPCLPAPFVLWQLPGHPSSLTPSAVTGSWDRGSPLTCLAAGPPLFSPSSWPVPAQVLGVSTGLWVPSTTGEGAILHGITEQGKSQEGKNTCFRVQDQGVPGFGVSWVGGVGVRWKAELYTFQGKLVLDPCPSTN